jgi:hypothetical protein
MLIPDRVKRQSTKFGYLGWIYIVVGQVSRTAGASMLDAPFLAVEYLLKF